MNAGSTTQIPAAKSWPRSWTYAYRPLRARSRTSPVMRIFSALAFARAASVSSSASSRSSSQPRMFAIWR